GAIQNLTATTLRNILGGHDLDSILNSREAMNAALTEALDRASDSWGIKVIRVELKGITPPHEVQDAMERQLRAERIKREQILQSEGEQQAQINQATGHRQAQILQAEGEAQAIETIAKARAQAIRIVLEAYKSADANERVMGLKYLDSLEQMAQGEATKILLPYEATAMLGSLAGLGEVFRMQGKAEAAGGKGEAAATGEKA
ncbi:MAG TPA: SPFH domain-containing protein, partial [Limnochordia bacterium]|nr:SPFH domain-containing protein [Limnochordia bacterium]